MKKRFSKIKKLTSLAVAASLSLALCACGQKRNITSQDTQIEITFSWWGNDARNEYTIEAIEKFEELYPNINVKCIYTEWSGYQTRTNVQMASNTESDVMQINYAWITKYSPDGLGYYDLSTLSDYIDFSNFTEEDIAYGMQKDHLNALPIALNTQTCYYNKSVYDRYGLDVPQTWDDLYAAAKIMKNDGIYPVAMSKKSFWFYATAYVEQTTGKQMIAPDGTLNFDAEDCKLMIEFYRDLINNNVIPQVEYFSKTELGNGQYAGFVAWVSDATSYTKASIEAGDEYVIGEVISSPSATRLGWYAKPATMYAISNDTEHPEEAALLLNYLLNSDEMASYQGIEKGIPISQSAREYLTENDMLNGIQYDAYLKMVENTDELDILSPYFETDEFIDLYFDSCNAVLYDKADLDEEANSFYTALKKELKKVVN